jgi:hypothetical protein
MSQPVSAIAPHATFQLGPPVQDSELETQEHALKELTDLLAAKMTASDIAREEVDRLYARWSVLKQGVAELRRRAGRINCKLGDGSRIYDLETVQ